jgi:hypothetical protein
MPGTVLKCQHSDSIRFRLQTGFDRIDSAIARISRDFCCEQTVSDRVQ